MNIFNKNKFYKLLKFICIYVVFINFAFAQEEPSKDNIKVNDVFPIAVVNMQAIVGESLAAVKVKEYIGQFEKGEQFQFRGMPCQCLISDHYWWIEAEDISTLLGPSPQAYIADSWLEPIKQPKKSIKLKKELDIFN